MVLITRILYLLLFLATLAVILAFLAMIRSFLVRVFSSPGTANLRSRVGADRARERVAGQMIKDPECGMYVATDLAITKSLKGETLYFCSEECRDNFITKRKRSDQPDRQAV